MKPTWWRYVLQSLQRHSIGSHFFMSDLNASRYPRSSVEQKPAPKFQVQENLMILYHNEHF